MTDRRDFIKTAGIAAGAALMPRFSFASVKGSDRIKVGLIGCGSRGTAAATNMIQADQNIEIVALADLFEDKPAVAEKKLSDFCAANFPKEKDDIIKDGKVKKFFGWDCTDQLLKEDVDVVIDATPPVFRTPHYAKIVEAGKHAFLEKPACVDAVQARKMLELSKKADEKGLSVVCGTQRRYHEAYQEIIKRIHDGMIGDIICAQCYWNDGGYVGHAQHDPKSDALPTDSMEYQIRNWSAFIWSSGDHIVEQHVHNLDVAMWAFGDNRKPLDVRGWGGRSTDLPVPMYGNRFSHFAADFDMGRGARIASYCHQDDGTSRHIGERIVGTKGIAEPTYFGKSSRITDLDGNVLYAAPENVPQAIVMEHKFLLDSIRSGRRVNRLETLVNSTLLAIAGRMSAYSGKKFKFDWVLAKSKESFEPEVCAFVKKEIAPVPVPGKTPLV